MGDYCHFGLWGIMAILDLGCGRVGRFWRVGDHGDFGVWWNVCLGGWGLRPDICSLLGASFATRAPSSELSSDFHGSSQIFKDFHCSSPLLVDFAFVCIDLDGFSLISTDFQGFLIFPQAFIDFHRFW